MLNPSNLAKEIFGILRSFDYTVDIFDYDGNRVYEPADARRFFASPRNITVSIYDDGENSAVKMFLSQSTSANEVAGLIDTMRVTSSKFGILFNVRKYERELVPKDLAPNSGIEHDSSVKLSTDVETKIDLNTIKSGIRDLKDEFPKVLKVLKTYKKDDVKESMTKIVKEDRTPMIELPAFGCKVEVAAWTAFKDEKHGSIDMYTNPEPIDEKSSPNPKSRMIAQLRAVAKVTKADGLANVFSIVSDEIESGSTSKLALLVAQRAIKLGYHATPIAEAKGDVEMVHLPTLGKIEKLGFDDNGNRTSKMIPIHVERSAWDDLKNGKIDISGDINFDVKMAQGANSTVFFLHEIAEKCRHHGLSQLLTFCADFIENNKPVRGLDPQKKAEAAARRALIHHIANVAIAAAKREQHVSEGLIVTESIRKFGSWFDSLSARSLFESDDEYRDTPEEEAMHSAMGHDDTYDQALDIAFSSVKSEFDIDDFLNTVGADDFNYGKELSPEEYTISEKQLRDALSYYIKGLLDQALDGTEYPSNNDVETLVDEFYPKVKEALESEDWTIETDNISEDIDMDDGESVAESDDELANEDVLLPVNAKNDLTREVTARDTNAETNRVLELSRGIRNK